MKYDVAFLEKVKAFGILGYAAHKIVYLVEPEDPEQFIRDFNDKESEVYKAFHTGSTTGEYTMDKSLFDMSKSNNIEANEKLFQRQRLKEIDAAIYERFEI